VTGSMETPGMTVSSVSKAVTHSMVGQGRICCMVALTSTTVSRGDLGRFQQSGKRRSGE
jgi:hypothetical protein